MKKKRVSIFLMILFMITFGMYAEGSRENRAEVSREGLSEEGRGAFPRNHSLRLGVLPDVDSIPFFVAQKNNYFEDHGVKVELVLFQSPIERDSAFQSGRIDGAVSDLLAAVFFNAGGFDARVTSATDGSYKLLTGSGGKISTVTQLAGASVGLSKNTIIEYCTDRICLEAGMDPTKLNKISVPKIPLRLQMLMTGQIDAATLPEPLATVAIYQGAQCIKSSDALGINPGVILFDSRVISTSKEAIKKMYQGYNDAVRYLRQGPDSDIETYLIERFSFPDVIKGNLNYPRYRIARLPDKVEFDEVSAWMRDNELARTVFMYDDIIQPDCLPEWTELPTNSSIQ